MRSIRRRARALPIARPTPRGFVFLVAGLIGIPAAYSFGRRELLYLACFFVVLPVVALLYVQLRRARMSVNRTFTPRVMSAGSAIVVDVEVRNLSSSASSTGTWRDTLPWHPDQTEEQSLPRLGAAASARLRYDMVPPLRGMLEIGPLQVSFSDPFGLAVGHLAVGGTQPIIVAPVVSALTDDAVSIAADEGPIRMAQRRSQGGEDDLMTREYRQGDALRRVHWRASARHGELMVRQEEQRSHAEARLVLDTRRSSYHDINDGHRSDEPQSESFEWAVAFTASLSLHLAREGFVVSVIETGAAQLAGVDRPDEFLESLATVRLQGGLDRAVSLLRGAERPDRSQGSIFAVLADLDSSTVAALVSQRRSFELAVAFMVGEHGRALERDLEEGGWVCVTVDADTTADAAWLAVAQAEVARRGRA